MIRVQNSLMVFNALILSPRIRPSFASWETFVVKPHNSNICSLRSWRFSGRSMNMKAAVSQIFSFPFLSRFRCSNSHKTASYAGYNIWWSNAAPFPFELTSTASKYILADTPWCYTPSCTPPTDIFQVQFCDQNFLTSLSLWFMWRALFEDKLINLNYWDSKGQRKRLKNRTYNRKQYIFGWEIWNMFHSFTK